MEPKILVPVDDSPTAHATINAIIAQKSRFPRKITLIYVINQDQLAYKMITDVELEMVKVNIQKAGKLLLEKHSSTLSEEGFEPETILEVGSARSVITNTANKKGFQLVIIGRHEGGGEIRDVLFGSVANYVLHNVACPVLLF